MTKLKLIFNLDLLDCGQHSHPINYVTGLRKNRSAEDHQTTEPNLKRNKK